MAENQMINALQLFQNIGQFDSVATGAALPLGRMTLVYAENGRGKTTIAAILRSLSSGDPIPVVERRRLGAVHLPHIVLACMGGPSRAIFQNGAWNLTLPNLAVFDDVFVDENVCSGLVIEVEHRQHLHEWILGSQGVALSRALQDCVERVEELNRRLRAKADAIPGAVRAGLNADDFCALQRRDDIDAAIQEAERALSAAERQETIRNARSFEPLALPEMETDEIARVLAMDLPELDAAAAMQVQAHLGAMGAEGEAWASSGMQWVGSGEQQDCPFCGQDLRGSSLIEHYRAYFSAGYRQLKERIADATEEFIRTHGSDASAVFERNVRIAVERRQFWSQFTDIIEINIDTATIAEAWVRARDAFFAALQRKQNAPLDRIRLSAADMHSVETYEQHQQAVSGLNDTLRRINEAIALVKERAATGNRQVLARDLAHLRAVKARHTAEIDALCADYLADKAAKTAAEQARDAGRNALDAYRERIFPNYETAINLYLQRFNAGFRLARITSVNTRGGSSCSYNVLINNEAIPVSGGQAGPGTPSFRNSLSAGDRSTLALAFFFASLDQDAALADKIVVVDDPITSLDEHRAIATVHEMRRLAERARQLILLSHDKGFLCNMWEGADPDLRSALEIVRDGDGSTIRRWNVHRDCITEHDRRHALLRDYTEKVGVNGREVAQSLRPALESFLRVAYPEYFPPGTLLGPFRGLCEQRVGTPQEILNQSDINELRDMTEYANRFHHDTNPVWLNVRINDGELLGFVRRTLAFTRR
jgi:wobble nucleotide-excising tRNase